MTEMDLADQYLERFGRKNGARSKTFAAMVAHVEYKIQEKGFGFIIETGTARTRENWEGDGQSTIIWDWLADKFMPTGIVMDEYNTSLRVISIDNNQWAIRTAREQTNHVQFEFGDSLKRLAVLPSRTLKNTWLLYLDSFDYKPGDTASAEHHLRELQTVWHYLPSECLIVVDDAHSETEGKHVLVSKFMESQGIKPLFWDYQIGWMKP